MTKAQVRQHLLNAPKGTDPGEIIEALRAKGVQMEGDPVQSQRGLLEPVPIEEGPSVGGFLKNVAKSGGRLAQNVGSALIHPIETTKNIAKLGIGAATNTAETIASPFVGSQKAEGMFNLPGEDLASNVGQNFVDRYSDEGLGKTLYEDPVGALSDVSLALGAAGKVAKLSGAATVGSELKGLAAAADPVTNASKAISGTVAKGVNAATKPLAQRAENLYQSALKPTKSVRNDFPTVVKTGLKNGIVLGKGSLDDVKGMLEDIRQQVDDSIDAASTGGQTLITTEDVVGRMQRAREFFNNVPGGSKYVEQLDGLADTFLKEQGQYIPLQKAQSIKKATYQIINDSYGQLEKAHTEGLKDIARGLKEEIVSKVPELKGLNLKQQELIGLEKALNDFLGRTGNRQSVDLATGMGTAVGMAASGLKGAAKAFATGKMLKTFLDDPAFKSWRALVYYRLGKGVAPTGKLSEKIGGAAKTLRAGELTNQAQ